MGRWIAERVLCGEEEKSSVSRLDRALMSRLCESRAPQDVALTLVPPAEACQNNNNNNNRLLKKCSPCLIRDAVSPQMLPVCQAGQQMPIHMLAR